MTEEHAGEALTDVAHDEADERRSYDEVVEQEKLESLYDESASDTAQPDATIEHDATAIDQPTPAEHAQPDSDKAEEPDSIAPRLSVKEWAYLQQVSTGVQQLRKLEADIADIDRALQDTGGDWVKLCNGDRARAAEAESQMRQVREVAKKEREAQAVIVKQLQTAQVSANQRKLFRAEPALAKQSNRAALAKWLMDAGYSAQDVSAINPRQAAAAWKIYQQSPAGKPKATRIPDHAKKKGRANGSTPNLSPDYAPEDAKTTELAFAAIGQPQPQTILYGLPKRKPPRTKGKSDRADILYGAA